MDDMGQVAFGQRLRAMRVARGLSQRALAGDGMSTGYLSRLESGARPPTKQAITYLAERLGISPKEFTSRGAPSLASVIASATSGESEATVTVLEELTHIDEAEEPAVRWQIRWLLADLKARLGEYEDECRYLTEIIALDDELAMPELQARARARLARCKRTLGELEEARTQAAEAFRIAQTAGLSVPDTAAALLVLVSTEAESGRLPDARAHADELIHLLEGVPGTLPVQALWAAATVRVRQGDFTAAQQFLDEALARLNSHDDLPLWMRLRLAAASLSLQQVPPRTDAAARWLREAEPAVALIGTRQHHHELTSLRAHLAFHQGHFDESRALYDSLAADEVQLSFRDSVTLKVLHNRLCIHEGREAEGVAGLRQLAQQAHDSGNVDLAAEIWRFLADHLARPQVTTRS